MNNKKKSVGEVVDKVENFLHYLILFSGVIGVAIWVFGTIYMGWHNAKQ